MGSDAAHAGFSAMRGETTSAQPEECQHPTTDTLHTAIEGLSTAHHTANQTWQSPNRNGMQQPHLQRLHGTPAAARTRVWCPTFTTYFSW
eukprot:2117939-Amphidinium_carterae.1